MSLLNGVTFELYTFLTISKATENECMYSDHWKIADTRRVMKDKQLITEIVHCSDESK